MKCPTCGVADLVRGVRDIQYTYRSMSTSILAVSGEFCPACGEMVMEMGESIRASRAMLEFNKQVQDLQFQRPANS